MTTAYTCQILREDGTIFLEGEIVFPNPASAPIPPFIAPAGQDVVLLEDSSDSILLQGGDDSDGVVMTNRDGSAHVDVVGDGVEVHGKVGFYGHTPVTQPAAPTDAASIIAALQTLGLVNT